MSESTALASIKEKMRQELAGISRNIPSITGRNISTRGKVFTLPDGRTSRDPIQAIVLDFRNFNRYYTVPWSKENPVPPACFALSKEHAGMKPHEEAEDPQHADCATCPHNQWGSATNGGKGKACSNTVRVALAAPDAEADSDPMLLNISPTGLKSWASMVSYLESVGMLPIQVVTQISFDENESYPKLVFKALGAHDDLEKFWQLREKAQSMLNRSPAGE